MKANKIKVIGIAASLIGMAITFFGDMLREEDDREEMKAEIMEELRGEMNGGDNREL